MGTLQVIDNIMQACLLIFNFLFIFDMMGVRALCVSDTAAEYTLRYNRLIKQKRFFIIGYTIIFFGCLFTFFDAYIRGIKEDSFLAPRILILWSMLMVRFTMDVTACILFLNQLFYFIKVKVEKLYEEERDLTGWHKFVNTT